MAKIKEINKIDRPREKAYRLGVEKLNDIELLAILLSSGYKNYSVLQLSNEVITKFNGLNNVFSSNEYDLTKIKGISKVKAIQIQTIKEIFKRINVQKNTNISLKINSSVDLYNYVKHKMINAYQEIVNVYYLNINNVLIYEQTISIGSDDMALSNNKLILKTAIEKYAKKVIMCHNHPSNNILPSRQDYITFETLKTALNLVNVKLLDSLIIGEQCFYSVLKEKIYNL